MARRARRRHAQADARRRDALLPASSRGRAGLARTCLSRRSSSTPGWRLTRGLPGEDATTPARCCFPNALLQGEEVAGYVDLGELGVAWRDLAVASRSVTWNTGPGREGLFLETHGVAPDPARHMLTS
ncbi:MAG: hypothetical protein H6713_16205 [Myxococcales bacterium]|nr:hypothetical protein [Myxococcales bacterium]